MNLIRELYDAHAHSTNAEEELLRINKRLMEFIELNLSANERPIFLDTVESIIQNREQYFFQAGFKSAKNLLLK